MHKKYKANTIPERCLKCCVSQHIDIFRCPTRKHQCRNCHKYGHFSRFATKRKKHLTRKGLWSQDHPKHINFRLAQFTHKIPYAASQTTCLLVKIQVQLKTTQVETKILAPQHLITNLAYKLKPHKKTQYFEGKIRHLSRCQHNACHCLQVDF